MHVAHIIHSFDPRCSPGNLAWELHIDFFVRLNRFFCEDQRQPQVKPRKTNYTLESSLCLPCPCTRLSLPIHIHALPCPCCVFCPHRTFQRQTNSQPGPHSRQWPVFAVIQQQRSKTHSLAVEATCVSLSGSHLRSEVTTAKNSSHHS